MKGTDCHSSCYVVVFVSGIDEKKAVLCEFVTNCSSLLTMKQKGKKKLIPYTCIVIFAPALLVPPRCIILFHSFG